jgi:hypothetical protein
MKIVGMVLIVLGIVGVLYGGMSWTTRDDVAKVGPVEITKDKTHSLSLPPIAGAVCLICGAGLLVMSSRSRA